MMADEIFAIQAAVVSGWFGFLAGGTVYVVYLMIEETYRQRARRTYLKNAEKE